MEQSKKGKKKYNTDELLKIMKKKQFKQLEKGGDKKEIRQDEEIDESDINILDPEEFQCVPTLGLEKMKAYEIQYWEMVSFAPKAFLKTIIIISKQISLIQYCPLLKIYQQQGCLMESQLCIIYVQVLPQQVEQFYHLQNLNYQCTIQYGLCWTFNNLDESGLIRVCCMEYNLKANSPKEQLKGIESLAEGYQTIFMFNALNSDFLAKNKRDINIQNFSFIHFLFITYFKGEEQQ